MDLTKYYPDIAAKYPAYVTKRELCEICHICPKTAYNLEQQGEIPYTIEQNHLIRSHKIKLTDILAYLYRRECRQEADSPYICAMRTFYDEHLSPYSDLLSVKDIQQITGFSSSAIVRWISTGILKAFQPGKQYTVPKDFMLMQAVRGELTVGTIRYSIFEGRPHISMIEVLEDYRRQGIATQMLRYLQGQYPNEEIVWGYLTEDGSALYQAVVDEQPNPDYLRVQNDLEDITREFDAYVRRLDGGAILSPQEAADMDDLEDTQYRLEKELEELRPIRAFVRMGDGTAAEAPAVMDEATSTDLAPLREPPAAPQVATHNFRFSEDYDLYPSGAKTKYKNNVMAIKLLKQIELEKRTATPEEQIILARYVGWGGLANAFSSTASGWENEYQELKSLLTDVEYKAAMNSTITAYYTEPDLIRHIYRALERFGFEGGPDRKILDPGMGTGNFYSVLPEQFQGSKLFGVELDSITGRIAKQLYPDADISIMGYEATKFEDNSFDVILGNIPFNSVKIYDRRYNDLNPYIHDYFFIKSLDLAKPGGIIAFITSKGIMDRKDESLREYIARRAEFIGAIRLLFCNSRFSMYPMIW